MVPRGWFLGPLLALLFAAPAAAADGWVAADVHGSVLVLVDGTWQEIGNGDMVGSGIAVRTLQAGRVVLQRGGEALQLAPNTVIRPNYANGTVTVEQFSGVLSMSEAGGGSSHLVTPTFSAVTASGSILSRVGGKSSGLSVRSGQVQLSAAGHRTMLAAGQAYAVQDGGTDTTSGMAPGDTSAGQAQTPDDGAPGSTGKQDNGVGNGGVPGNGGQNGNAGGDGGAPVGEAQSGKAAGTGGSPGNGGQRGNAGGNGNSGQHRGAGK